MSKNHFCYLAGVVLMLCFCLHLIWWLRFSAGLSRYLVVAFFYYFSGLILLIVNLDHKSMQLRAAIIVVIFLMLAGRVNAVKYLFFDGFKKNERLQEQLAVVDVIQKFEEDGVTMIACGNNFELEYLLPGSGHFKNCEEVLQRNSFSGRVMLVSYFLEEEKVLSIKHDQYYGAIKPLPVFALKICKKVFLKTANFSLNWCD